MNSNSRLACSIIAMARAVEIPIGFSNLTEVHN